MGHDQNGICHELLRFHGYFMGFNQPTWYHILALKIHRNNPKSTASSCVWNSPISFWHSHIYRGFKNRGTHKSSSKSLVQIWTEKKPISIHFWWFAIHRAILLGANKKVQCHNVGFMADIYIYIFTMVCKQRIPATYCGCYGFYSTTSAVPWQNHVFGRQLPSGFLVNS